MIELRARLVAPVIAAAPLIALPVFAHAATFADLVNKQIVPLGDTLINVLYALCFIAFLIGMVRFFFSDSEENRQKGKQFAVWGIIALAVLFAAWGIVHTLLTILMDIGST